MVGMYKRLSFGASGPHYVPKSKDLSEGPKEVIKMMASWLMSLVVIFRLSAVSFMAWYLMFFVVFVIFP